MNVSNPCMQMSGTLISAIHFTGLDSPVILLNIIPNLYISPLLKDGKLLAVIGSEYDLPTPALYTYIPPYISFPSSLI